MSEYPNFSDFAEETKVFGGDKKKIEDILNQEILIVDFKVKSSKHKQGSLYATIQFKIGDTNYIVFTGSGVLIDQLEKYKGSIPFYTTIKKIDRYYTFS
jgi:hypothetical protein